ncbi:ATP-dependent DNA helicase [Variovorax terrae]|uniref:ATP-dependent RecD-like DNA helicase n=1 Tax=Variovorax terrae TaxID=2923278 RepID=A0A9X1VWZ2_9BURK|nr:ATP-dependent RecD-like DNA helicase [Variovorax terrae]MCJ0765361.1 ATP-dependent RecD-like DNA helicase [Variovorax terrae]
MTTVGKQIQSADKAICQNIEALANQRALLSQNVLSLIRNLIEGITVRLHTGTADAEFNYDAIEPGLAFIKSKAKFNFLGRFHKLIQKSASHYTLDGDASERLMLKYYEYLHRTRSLLQDSCGIAVLANLEAFPIDLDPSLREYHEKIAERIDAPRSSRSDGGTRERYYIHKTRPFFVRGRIYYEVTFYRAVNKVSKFDRLIAFTRVDMTDKYAAMLMLQRDSIEVLGHTMPVAIIREWEVSIRPCEFDNFARLLGKSISTRTNSVEYQHLMGWLTEGAGSLVDLLDMSDSQYAVWRTAGTDFVTKLQIFPVLDEVRRIVKSASSGQNILRYLMLRMHNQTIKAQYNWNGCDRLSGMKLQFGCIPFETMPFCTSLPGHNPRYWDLVESLEVTGRNHELLARRVKNNVERHGILYAPVADLEEFGEVSGLIFTYNNRLYYKHTERRLMLDKKHVFICGYENETVSIVEKLQTYALSRIDGYTQAVERWLSEARRGIDDPAKENALKQLFSQSRVALIYGAAGTGKSTMVDHIAHYFNDKQKLFLAHTNPAIDNLKRKVTAQNSDFRTISSQISRKTSSLEFDLLVIDECSTVSNADLIKVLEKTSFKLLVLVGDVYQIESIQFGNWFGIIRSFIPSASVFELTTPFRTKNNSLLRFWDKVRAIEDDIAEVMAHNGYSTVLDKTLFEAQGQDEIILCLNYDGLYGINNVNRFLQSGNPGAATIWRVSTYKIGDPVLFNETERFRPVIYNNLKGRIVGIDHARGRIQFDIELDRPLSEFDVDSDELEWMGGSTVRFSVYESDASDEDDDSLNITVPFQVAYAVSIHKAQGLEYDSVKIVVTDANEDDITHSIFYTAITRARERLQIFWTPETQQRVLKKLTRGSDSKDVTLLASRRSLTPVGG